MADNKKQKQKKQQGQKDAENDGTGKQTNVGKKQTKLGLEIKKDENYSEWYSQVCETNNYYKFYQI